MPITDNVMTSGAAANAASGNSGSAKRRNPYVPILSSTAARMTDPPVGASTWASGNQVWNGNNGTLMANERPNAANSQPCTCAGTSSAAKCNRSNDGRPNCASCSAAKYRMATSISRLPASVYSRNFSAA